MKQDKSLSKYLRIDVKKISKNQTTKAKCEVLAVAPDGKSGKPDSFALHKDFKEYRDVVEQLVRSAELSAASSGNCLIRFGGIRAGDHLLLQGTGLDKEGVNALGPVERLRRLGALVANKLSAERIKEAVIHLDSFLIPATKLSTDPATAAYAFLEGLGLANYRFKKYFSAAKDQKEEAISVTLVSAESSKVNAYAKGAARAQAMLLGAEVCRDLGNEPSNELYPEEFAERMKKLAAAHRMKCTVLDERAMKKEKMGLLLGVGQGSEKPPRLIVLEYNPPKKAKKTIAFVGKGITFDSGGISIKPSGKMEDMKHDMCGAAAVVGATVAAAELKLPVRIITVVAAAENMPSGNAIQPGNILKGRSGKTVEIVNTDAEGRLVLADALDYVQDMKPDYVINLATLTGAITITLGKVATGLMSNDTGFAKQIQNASRQSGERVWELPLFDEYFEELKSEYADMRNSGDGPSHGSQKGGMFLQQFIRRGTRWAHLDIAALAYAAPFVPYYPRKSSSGYGVRLLVELAKQIG